jgi:misacylated tRNA(Ala) deacylase
LCLKDSYQKECTAKVVAVFGNRVELDKTVFYPTGGGVPCDFGVIEKANEKFAVTEVRKDSGRVLHTVDREGLTTGDEVRCEIDWPRRYALICMHTSLHVLGSIAFGKGYKITGNQVGPDETRVDLSMEEFDRSVLDAIIGEANAALAQDVELKISEMPREQALAIPEMVKLANVLPPNIPILRIVEIPGVDIQADGGPHVHNLNEIGRIVVIKLDNKGAKNKRLYYKLGV